MKIIKEFDIIEFTSHSKNCGQQASVTKVKEDGSVLLHSFSGIRTLNGEIRYTANVPPEEYNKIMVVKRKHLSVVTDSYAPEHDGSETAEF